jgi:hypothetical protein
LERYREHHPKLPMPAWTGSTPIIWRDLIFLNVADGDNLYLWCVDRRQPAVVWKQMLGGGNMKLQKQNYVIALTSNRWAERLCADRHRACSKASTSRREGDLGQGHSEGLWTFRIELGYASSPLLYEDSLFVQVLHGMKTKILVSKAHRQEDGPHAMASRAADKGPS